MAYRYPYDREAWGRDRDDRYYADDRGVGSRAREDREPWFGENEEIARQRRADERERQRFETGARERWGATSAWGNPHSYSSGREYGDRDYARPGARDRGQGWRRETSMPSYTGMGHGHYAEPGYIGARDYGREGYGERYGAREWSSVEGWRVPGPHVGRGPKGYQRSDERIQDELHERLTAHGLIDATDVECRVVDGEVTLTGFVDSRAAKRAAEDLAEDIHGVRQVRNELRIRSHATDEGVGRTSVLGLTESQMQRAHSPGTETERPRTRT